MTTNNSIDKLVDFIQNYYTRAQHDYMLGEKFQPQAVERVWFIKLLMHEINSVYNTNYILNDYDRFKSAVGLD